MVPIHIRRGAAQPVRSDLDFCFVLAKLEDFQLYNNQQQPTTTNNSQQQLHHHRDSVPGGHSMVLDSQRLHSGRPSVEVSVFGVFPVVIQSRGRLPQEHFLIDGNGDFQPTVNIFQVNNLVGIIQPI